MAQICMILSENLCHCATPLAHAELCTNSVLSACLVYARADESDLLEIPFWLAYKLMSVTTSVSIFKYAIAEHFLFVLRVKGMCSCIAGMPDCMSMCMRELPGAKHTSPKSHSAMKTHRP